MKTYLIFLTIFLVGCTSIKSYESYALINDVTNPSTDYELVMVDGGEVSRKWNSIYTEVPFAVVAPGRHCFKFKKRNLLLAQPMEKPEFHEILENVAAGKLYQVAQQNGLLVLVEDLSYKK
jgi:hypothetical protein